jgi:hypothetical protein
MDNDTIDADPNNWVFGQHVIYNETEARETHIIINGKNRFIKLVIDALAIAMKILSKIHSRTELDTGMYPLIGQVVKYLKKAKMCTLSQDGR